MIRWKAGTAALGAVLVTAACGGGQMTDSGNMGMTGPSVGSSTMLLSMSPAPGATGVAAGVTITMRFSQPMALGMEQLVDLHEGDIGGPIVPMTCAWSTDSTALTCTPGAALRAHTRYLIHLGAGMEDMGHHLLDLDAAVPMGGQWVMPSMMGALHGGMPWGMMAPGWRGANGSYGMVFGFTTT